MKPSTTKKAEGCQGSQGADSQASAGIIRLADYRLPEVVFDTQENDIVVEGSEVAEVSPPAESGDDIEAAPTADSDSKPTPPPIPAEAAKPRKRRLPPPPPAPKAKGMMFEANSWSGALKAAKPFIGDSGRVADMIDLVDGLLEGDANVPLWQSLVTSNTGLYVGQDERGELVAIVAHGRGPLSGRNIHIPEDGLSDGWCPISQKDFDRMLYTECDRVVVIPLSDCPPPKGDSAFEPLSQSEATTHPLVQAIFGPRINELFSRLSDIALKSFNVRGMDDFCKAPLIGLKDLIRTALKHKANAGRPWGRIMTLSGLNYRFSHGEPMLTIGRQADGQPTKVVGVNRRARLGRIYPGPSWVEKRFGQLRARLSQKTKRDERPKTELWNIIHEANGCWYTRQSRLPDSLEDSHEPEFVIKKRSKIVASTTFRTTLKDPERPGTLLYHQLPLMKMAAKHGANAYHLRAPIMVEEIANGELTQMVEVDFYSVRVNQSRRLPRWDEVAEDFEAQMNLVASLSLRDLIR